MVVSRAFSSQAVNPIGGYTLRSENQSLWVYPPTGPTSFHSNSTIHYLLLSRGSKGAGRVPEFPV